LKLSTHKQSSDNSALFCSRHCKEYDYFGVKVSYNIKTMDQSFRSNWVHPGI